MANILIKSVACIIPGYTDSTEGELISTEEILFNMRNLNGDAVEKFKTTFIKEKIGIESVAFSKCSTDFVRKYWSMDVRPAHSEIFNASQSTSNESIYIILKKAIQKCLNNLYTNDQTLLNESFLAHIHISSFLAPCMESKFLSIRQSLGISTKKPLHTLILQQGCSGLFSAIEMAKIILKGSSASNILITADNNMMIHAHQRCQRIAQLDNINQWLWPAIFGEGVGAMIVGLQKPKDSSNLGNRWGFIVNSFEQEVIETTWRVAHQWKTAEQSTSVFIKAKEVSETYLKNIKKFALRAIEKSKGLDNLFKLCLHESNPRLLSIMRRELNIYSDDLVPSISGKVGTLACVSSFSLLDLTLHALKEQNLQPFSNKNSEQKSKLALVLIGETGGNIIAGNLCLSLTRF